MDTMGKRKRGRPRKIKTQDHGQNLGTSSSCKPGRSRKYKTKKQREHPKRLSDRKEMIFTGSRTSPRVRRNINYDEEKVEVEEEEDHSAASGGIGVRSEMVIFHSNESVEDLMLHNVPLLSESGDFREKVPSFNCGVQISGVSTPNVQSSQLVLSTGQMEGNQISVQLVKNTMPDNTSPSEPKHPTANDSTTGMQILGVPTPDGQSSLLVSTTGKIGEKNLTSEQLVKNFMPDCTSPSEDKQPTEDDSTSKVEHLRSILQTHSSPTIAVADSGEWRMILEKFMRMRSILENDEKTLQLLETLNQNDGRGESEKMAAGNDNDDCSTERMRCGSFLKKIISAHGNIVKDCSFSCTNTRSHFLKRVCHICKKLEASNILTIDVFMLSSICQELVELEKANVNVKWLLDRVHEIIESAEEVATGKAADVIERKEALLEGYKKELEFHKSRAASLEEVVKEEEEELNSRMKKFKTIGESLVHGLF